MRKPCVYKAGCTAFVPRLRVYYNGRTISYEHIRHELGPGEHFSDTHSDMDEIITARGGSGKPLVSYRVLNGTEEQLFELSTGDVIFIPMGFQHSVHNLTESPVELLVDRLRFPESYS